MRRVVAIVLTGALGPAAAAACGDPVSAPTAPIEDGGADVAESTDASDATAADATDATEATDATPACALPGAFGSAGCMRCMAARCCAVVSACAADPACEPLQRCILDCLPKPDAGGCAGECRAAHPGGELGWQPVEDCWHTDPPEGCLVDCT